MPGSIVADLSDMLADTIIWESLTDSGGGLGGATYADEVPLIARVSGRIRRVRGLDGTEVVSTVTAIVGGAYGIKVGDRITLPARFSPNQPSIVAVAKQTDETALITKRCISHE